MMKRTLIVTTIITLALVLSSVPSTSVEKEIKIGYSTTPAGVNFYFSVPVTSEMMQVIRKQEGVAFTVAEITDRYKVFVSIGKMFSPKETILNIVRALETEIFAGKVVRAQPVK